MLGAGVAVLPLYLMIIPYIAQGSPRRRVLLSIAAGILICVIFVFSFYTVVAVSGLAFENGFDANTAIAVAGMGVMGVSPRLDSNDKAPPSPSNVNLHAETIGAGRL